MHLHLYFAKHSDYTLSVPSAGMSGQSCWDAAVPLQPPGHMCQLYYSTLRVPSLQIQHQRHSQYITLGVICKALYLTY